MSNNNYFTNNLINTIIIMLSHLLTDYGFRCWNHHATDDDQQKAVAKEKTCKSVHFRTKNDSLAIIYNTVSCKQNLPFPLWYVWNNNIVKRMAKWIFFLFKCKSILIFNQLFMYIVNANNGCYYIYKCYYINFI